MKGFTLVEILVAIIILAIGILAVSQMTVMGIRTSGVINRHMYARQVLSRCYETIANMPTSDTTVLKHRTSTSLDDTITCDYRQQENTAGGAFQVIWNIQDNFPDNRFKTVRIHVIPLGRMGKRTWQSDLLKAY